MFVFYPSVYTEKAIKAPADALAETLRSGGSAMGSSTTKGIPNACGLKAAVLKKQTEAEFLDDLKKIPQAYAQSVYQLQSVEIVYHKRTLKVKKNPKIILRRKSTISVSRTQRRISWFRRMTDTGSMIKK